MDLIPRQHRQNLHELSHFTAGIPLHLDVLQYKRLVRFLVQPLLASMDSCLSFGGIDFACWDVLISSNFFNHSQRDKFLHIPIQFLAEESSRRMASIAMKSCVVKVARVSSLIFLMASMRLSSRTMPFKVIFTS